MATVRISAGEFGAAMRRRIAADTEILRKTASSEAAKAVFEAQAETDRQGLTDLGSYRKGWRVVVRLDGAEVRNDSPHATVVEYGRRPGKPPPIRFVRGWAARKLGLPEPEAGRVAFLIARKIAREGMKPRFIFRDVYARMRVSFRATALRELRR